MPKFRRTLITAALPYANGPIHLGHLVEYIQTDIFVRFLRLKGQEVIFICADDAHGTPIEVNAAKQKISPEQLIEKYFKEHTLDFSDFLISFDNYYTTNSPENKHYSDLFFSTLMKKGFIYQKEVELTYCETDKRFLPDRFVKGKCPKCGKEDQYGDVCESCNSAYKTTDLINPYCIICRSKPSRKKSLHYFFKLSSFSEKLEEWIRNNDFQEEVKSYLLNWIKDGLEDWDITRDGPYFGFKIPGEEDKYYYVWLDAPIGYIASTENYAKSHGKSAEHYWKEKDSRIIHFIGKDIAYFHFLFWPAMLMGTEFNIPDAINVHGFLTVNGEKMSKSRGTFITARDFLKKNNPEHLRFYYAANLARTSSDLDFSFEDFAARINNELVSNIANYAYRVLSFINSNFDSEVHSFSKENFEKTEKIILEKFELIKKNYESLNYREAVKHILEVSDIGNKNFQENEPWILVKNNRQKCAEVVSFASNIVKNLSILLYPIIPRFCGELQNQLNLKNLGFKDLKFNLKNHKISHAKIIFAKIEVQKNKEIPLSLKIAKIEAVEEHPDAENLYVLKISLGNEKRQLVAGIKNHYTKEDLLGRNIVVITNLRKANIRGVASEGMLLAADNGKVIKLLSAEKSETGDKVFFDGINHTEDEIDIDKFKKISLRTKNKRVLFKDKILRTEKEEVAVDIEDGAIIR